MKSHRVISMLVISGLLTICTSLAYAQAGGAAQLKKRIFQEATSGQRIQSVDNLRDADAATPEAAQGHVSINALDKKKGLLGTWNITLTFPDGSQAKTTLQVFPGRSDTDGSVIHASEFSLAPPSPTLPEQGVWEYVGGQQFISSYRGYSFTEQLEPFGFIGFRHAITVSADQESFTGRAVFEVIDSTGQVLFSDTCTSRGVRQHAVAP